MSLPLGPSMRIAVSLADAFACASCGLILAAWEHWLGPQRSTRKLARLEATGFFETATLPNLERVVRFTEAGLAAAAGGRNPDACWQRHWDERWRFALFDVPERDRQLRRNLRFQLRRLHFGLLQKSAWLSPDPFDVLQHEIAKAQVDARSLIILDCSPCGGETDADLVAAAWDFPRINRCYEDYLKILDSHPRWGGPAARANWLQAEWRAWLRAFRIDPLLPAPLLPPHYRGREAWRRRNALFKRLLGTSKS